MTRKSLTEIIVAVIAGVATVVAAAVAALITARIGAQARPPDQKTTIKNDLALGFRIISGAAPITVSAPPKPAVQPSSTMAAVQRAQPQQPDAFGCTGLDPERLKIEGITVEGISGAQKNYKVVVSLRNISNQLVSLEYVDPVQLNDDQGNHIPLRTTWLRQGSPRNDDAYARSILTGGMKIESNYPTPINFTFGPVDQIGGTVSLDIPLVEGSESNGKDLTLLLRLDCQGIPVR